MSQEREGTVLPVFYAALTLSQNDAVGFTGEIIHHPLDLAVGG